MKLEQIANDGRAWSFDAISADRTLATQVQQCLARVGLLDPPPDGSFGPVSRWALRAYLVAIDRADGNGLDATAAQGLLSPDAADRFPVRAGQDDLAGRIHAAMARRGDWLCRHPDAINIVYVEGMNVDGEAVPDTPNEFNDLRVVLQVAADGSPRIAGQWAATTAPGRHYVKVEKLDPNGAAHIELGQHKAWAVGMHKASSPSGHEGLVQVADVPVSRDLDENFRRAGDRVFVGMFGINQHWGFDRPMNDVHNASAGCLVGRSKREHVAFMALCKRDARYVANHGYRFMTSILRSTDL